MTDMAWRSAQELAGAIRAGEIGSRELLDHYLQRIEKLNSKINSVVTLDVERARQRADAADAARAGGKLWGPLHGLPMTVKDSFETAGIRTTSGSKMLAQHVPETDAIAVRRLIDAGAIVFGKTNLPTYAMDAQSYNPIFGTTNNPWDTARSPGGSSGGSAAAVATGLTSLELGSDIGGSIRIPAHYCGVYGHKPTFGIVPTRGHIPGPPGSLGESDIAVAGPLARCAEDLQLALDILAGPTADRATAWRFELPPPRRSGLREFRVAAWFDDAACPVDRTLLERYAVVADELRRAGVTVNDQARPSFAFAEAQRIFTDLMYAATSPLMSPKRFRELSQTAEQLAPEDESSTAQLIRGSTMRHRDWQAANETRLRLRAAWQTFFRDYDVLLCPVTPTAAIPHDQSEPAAARLMAVNGETRPYFDQIMWPGIIGVSYLPATVAPVGKTAAGLPMGIQIVGPYLEDRTPIAFAGHLAKVIGGFEAPPGY